MPEPRSYHVPVLLQETLHYLAPQPGETMLDATLGGGGHSEALAQRLRPGGTLIGLDRDADALATAGGRLEPYQPDLAIILISTGFGNMDAALEAQPATTPRKMDGFLFDLGVSSHQLDTERGFSFRRDEFLDMRMARTGTEQTAAALLATASEAEIARILWEYGEERFSRRIAAAIVAQRERGQPVQTTAELAALVERAVPRAGWPKEIHVATRTFQGIRIAVNDELGQLEAGLTAAIARLNPGGRLVVLSYHSLEDRIAKRIFAQAAGRTPNAPGSSPAAWLPSAMEAPTLTLSTRKPVLPTEAEIAQNPRARSAKLRAATRTTI
jgi:16S rRNA (cytosine1402-N4)-methyltransferase